MSREQFSGDFADHSRAVDQRVRELRAQEQAARAQYSHSRMNEDYETAVGINKKRQMMEEVARAAALDHQRRIDANVAEFGLQKVVDLMTGREPLSAAHEVAARIAHLEIQAGIYVERRDELAQEAAVFMQAVPHAGVVESD